MSAVGSILTNQGALDALQSINTTSTENNTLENELSTGLAITSPASNPAGFIKLDHVVFPDRATGERHIEDVAHAMDSLPGRRLRQVVIAVPPRLLRGIRDQLEDVLWSSRDLAAGADDAWHLVLGCHALIQTAAPATQGSGP